MPAVYKTQSTVTFTQQPLAPQSTSMPRLLFGAETTKETEQFCLFFKNFFFPLVLPGNTVVNLLLGKLCKILLSLLLLVLWICVNNIHSISRVQFPNHLWSNSWQCFLVYLPLIPKKCPFSLVSEHLSSSIFFVLFNFHAFFILFKYLHAGLKA